MNTPDLISAKAFDQPPADAASATDQKVTVIDREAETSVFTINCPLQPGHEGLCLSNRDNELVG
ncbi:hypothetical protein D3C85_1926850 [compost metagenome]